MILIAIAGVGGTGHGGVMSALIRRSKLPAVAVMTGMPVGLVIMCI